MIVLNECRIDAEGKHLIIEATVENLEYYKNVFIESVVIDTNETYSESGPSSKAIYTKQYEYEYINVDTNDENNTLKTNEDCKCSNVYLQDKRGRKNIRLVLTPKDLNLNTFNDNIFFVYINAVRIPSAKTPCGMDNKGALGVAYNMRPIYNMAMSYIKELSDTCQIPKGLIDMILRIKALEFSFKTGNYFEAFNLWNKLFKRKRVVMSHRGGCGCNGGI